MAPGLRMVLDGIDHVAARAGPGVHGTDPAKPRSVARVGATRLPVPPASYAGTGQGPSRVTLMNDLPSKRNSPPEQPNQRTPSMSSKIACT